MEHTELVIECQRGNVEAFDELYRLYSQKAFKTACFIAGNKELAEDIVQEAFTQCFFEIRKLKKPEAFDHWFYSILVRLGWRISGKRKNALLNETNIEDIDLIKSDVNTEDLIMKKEIYNKVDEALQALSFTLRTTVILHYYNGLSVKDISSIMGCFQGTVKSRLHTARKSIGRKLDRYIGEDFPYENPIERSV